MVASLTAKKKIRSQGNYRRHNDYCEREAEDYQRTHSLKGIDTGLGKRFEKIGWQRRFMLLLFLVRSEIDGRFVWLENCDPGWSQTEWINYSIDHYLPWYVNFLSSWAKYTKTTGGHHIRYERLFSDPGSAFESIIRSLGEEGTVERSVVEKNFATSKEMSS